MPSDVLFSIPLAPPRSAVDALAVASTMFLRDRETAGGSSSLPASLSMIVDNPPCEGIEAASISAFVDTWISAPVRVIAPRDFTFKAVIGEPDW